MRRMCRTRATAHPTAGAGDPAAGGRSRLVFISRDLPRPAALTGRTLSDMRPGRDGTFVPWTKRLGANALPRAGDPR